MRGRNTGVLCGVQEMDGTDILGREHERKRNKPQGGGKSKGKPKLPEELLAQPKDSVGPPLPPKHGKKASQPAMRRILLVMRQRSVAKGRGGVSTRVAPTLVESALSVTLMATRYASAESVVMTDEDPAYAAFARYFSEWRSVKHSETYALPDGTNNNQAESFNKRMRRAEKGTYLNISQKHLMEYSCEQAWRKDTRAMGTGSKVMQAIRYALNVGLSLWFRGYTHGKHRLYEMLIEGDKPAKARGKRKGWKPPKPR